MASEGTTATEGGPWTPVAFAYAPMGEAYAVRVEARGRGRWAIVEGGACLNRDGE